MRVLALRDDYELEFVVGITYGVTSFAKLIGFACGLCKVCTIYKQFAYMATTKKEL